MSNRPYGQKQARRQARYIKALGCIQKGQVQVLMVAAAPK